MQGVGKITILNVIPLAALRRVLGSILAVLQANHPGFFERMEGYCETRFLIDPVDIPFAFTFLPDPLNASIEPSWDAGDDNWDVRVTGRLNDLVDLFEGEVDGDALFFSRAITVEGDTSAVLALRNAIDSEEIKLVSEIAARFGPFGAPIRIAGENAPRLLARSHDFVEGLRARILKPVVEPLKQNNQSLREELERLKSELASVRAGGRSRVKSKKPHAQA